MSDRARTPTGRASDDRGWGSIEKRMRPFTRVPVTFFSPEVSECPMSDMEVLSNAQTQRLTGS